MKISVITICYNSENEIEATMRSVLAQTVTGIEYLIVDGASRDATVQIAEGLRDEFEARGIELRISSEPDGGIYDAMNKGIRLATGDVIGILNAGDRYAPETVEKVMKAFTDTNCELLFGNIRMHRTDGNTFIKKARIRKFQTSRDWNHPTTFVKSEVYKSNPFRDLGVHDDYGFYLQMRRQNRRIITIDETLADFFMGGVSNHKSVKAAMKRIKDRYQYCYRINGYSRWYIIECVAIEVAKMLFG